MTVADRLLASADQARSPRRWALSRAELVAASPAIGFRRTRTWALAVGFVLSIAIWIIGQDLGLLYSGQGTDPNSAPLIALMAVALLAWSAKVGTARLAADATAAPPAVPENSIV